MTEQHIKEQLSRAFVKAIAADAGFILREYELDYGLDGKFSEVEYNIYDEGHKRFCETGFGIDFQLKATTDIEHKNEHIIYDLEAKNYNDLVKTNVGTPRILILYLMPKERNEWLKVNSSSTTMQKCAWWCSLKGGLPTSNSQSKRIKIPDGNLLTPAELCKLISRVKEGVDL
jgi:hypothetical protein